MSSYFRTRTARLRWKDRESRGAGSTFMALFSSPKYLDKLRIQPCYCWACVLCSLPVKRNKSGSSTFSLLHNNMHHLRIYLPHQPGNWCANCIHLLPQLLYMSFVLKIIQRNHRTSNIIGLISVISYWLHHFLMDLHKSTVILALCFKMCHSSNMGNK